MAKKYETPKWIKSVPKGSHGTKSNDLTFRYWKVVSDYVRIKDYLDYGYCVSCKKPFVEYKQSQAGHYKTWGSSNAYAKYNIDNIAGQCGPCNNWGSFEEGAIFLEELKMRKGDDVYQRILKFHNEQSGNKMEKWDLVDKTYEMLLKIKDLGNVLHSTRDVIMPDYIKRALDNREKELSID